MAAEALAGSATDELLRRQILREQIDILYRHVPLAQGTNMVVATLLCWFLWPTVSQPLLLGWWTAILIIVLVRFALLEGYRRRPPESSFPWHLPMTVATAFSGVAWGSAGLLFFIPDSAATLIFVTIILAGMSAGSISSHSSWLPAQFSYATLTMVPIAVRFLLEGGEIGVLGVMCLIYLFNILAFARQLSRTLIDAIRLRLENQALVQQLRAEMSAADQARSEAEKANLAKSKFLASASHDLRQPLHAISLFIEALRAERDPERAVTVLNHLQTSAQSLENLFNELLDISKLEAGLFKPEIRVVSLHELFDKLERELRPVAEEKGLELCFVDTGRWVESDPGMLGRILRNIIANAIRHTERGAVLVGCRRRGEQVAVAVCDTGPGIAPEHHEAIFREFYQLGNPERDRRKGLGLGLAIVDGLCRVLGHRIELKSRPGHGSTFTIVLPEAAGPADEAESTPRPVAALDLTGFSVLVVDDDPDILLAMREVLLRWGCIVRTAASPGEAVSLIDADDFRPEMIVADYRLREGRTGSEAVARIRERLGRSIPAAILTGDTAPERLREVDASGLLLLHKPVQPARLRAALAYGRAALAVPSAPDEDPPAGIVS